MSENLVREYVENSTRCATNNDNIACIAASNQANALNYSELREASRRMAISGVLPQVTVVNLRRNFDQFDADRNGAVTSAEVMGVIRDQTHRPENQRNNATLNTARDTFHMMQQEGRHTYARTDFQRTDNLTPAARSHAQAMESFISLRERMRAIDPTSIHEGQISVSGLKTALQRSPGYFLPNEREAANHLLANRDTLAQSTGFFNRLYNMGNTDGMYFNQETLANRARELGVTGLNGYGPQLPGALAFQQPGQPYFNRAEAALAGTYQLQSPPDFRMDLPQYQTQMQPQDNALAMQPASEASPRGFMPSGDTRFTLYSVRKNDTLSAISRDFLTRSSGSTPTETQVYNFVSAIARESGITNPNLLHPNQTLRIPANWQLAVQAGYGNQR